MNNICLEILEDKLITNLDYQFLIENKAYFPHNNAYYLVCFVEALNYLIDKEKSFNSIDEALISISEMATQLYHNVNISTIFENELFELD